MRGAYAFVAAAVLLVVPPPLWAAPPSVEVPPEVKAVGDYVTVVPKTDAKAITYLGASGVDPFPSAMLKDAKTFVLPVRGLPPGRYQFRGVASLNDEHTLFAFVVVVGDAPVPPPPPPPGPLPDGRLGLVKASRDGFARVTAGRDKAAALAQAQRSHASAVAAGAFGDDPAKILAGWRAINKAAADAAQWAEWGRAVSARLAELHQGGKLGTRAEWAEAFREAAEGLGG